MNGWRYDVFNGVYVPVQQVDEIHTIAFQTEWNAYGIQLNEAPQKSTPSTVEIFQVGTGEVEFTEVPFNQAPGAGEFRVDYETTNQFGTGRIQFNGADNGKQVRVTYYGLGELVTDQGIAAALESQSVTVADLTVTGAASVGTTLGVTGAAALSSTLAVTGSSTFTGGFKTEGSDLFRVKKIDIGSWDMDATANVSVLIGLTDAECLKIVDMEAIIFQDDLQAVRRISTTYGSPGDLVSGSIRVFLTSLSGGAGAPVATIDRVAGGLFDTTSFNDTGINRGYIYIVYMV